MEDENMISEMAGRGRNGISGMTLKIIALLLMFIDHAALIFFAGTIWYLPGRILGRISFPIFCFLIVEGYCHTRSVRRYAGRLFLFALISEIPFDYAFFGRLVYMGYQNVFFTLFLGLLALACYDVAAGWGIRGDEKWMELSLNRKVIYSAAAKGMIILILLAAWFFHTDYNAFGVVLILVLYIGRNRMNLKNQQMEEQGNTGQSENVRIYQRRWNYYVTTAFPAALVIIGYGLLKGFSMEGFGALALILIGCYNGEKGNGRIPSLLFYAIYPLHLLLAGLLSVFLAA